MNLVYRVVFNRSLNCLQVVSELGARSAKAASAGLRIVPRLAPLATAALLCCISASALAADPGWNEWQGTVDIDWSDPANWQLGVPTATSSPASIDSGRTVMVSGFGASSSLIRVGDTGLGTLDIQSGGALQIGTDAFLGYARGAVGNIAVDGRDSRLDVGQTLYVGQSGEGKVEVTGGASMTSTVAHIRKGVVEVSGAGSSWTNSRNLAIGDIGPGTLRILDGGQVNVVTGAVTIGDTNRALGSGHGEVLVSGAGSRFSISGSSASLGVGMWGYGSLTVENGGTAELNASLGMGFDASGRVLVTGAGSSWTGDDLFVGAYGKGYFEIADGATAEIRGQIGLNLYEDGSGTLRVGEDAVLIVGGRDPNAASRIFSNNGGGSVELEGGTLRSQGDLVVSTNLTVGAASTLDTDAQIDISGAIGGTGRLYKVGSGNLLLRGNNTWSGGLQVDQGSVSASGNQALGSGLLEMADGTALALADGVVLGNQIAFLGAVDVSVATGASATLAGALRDGVLVKREGGELVLGGGAFSGATRVEEGTLRLLNLALPTGDIYIGGAGTVQLDSVGTFDYAGKLSGTGTFRQGRNQLVFSGDSSGYAGTVAVDGGHATINGSLGGQLNLSNQAQLAGNGTIGSAHLMSGSVLDPGAEATVGRLAVSGDLIFDGSASYRVDVAADGSSDQVDVAGRAVLGGASTLAVAASGDWQPSTRYTVLTAGNGISGNFSTVDTDFAFLTPMLSYDANAVYLTMARNMGSFAGLGLTANQQQVAGAVEALGYGHAVYDAAVRLSSEEVIPAFDSLSGEVHASTRGALLQNRFLHDGIDRYLDGAAISGEIGPGIHAWLAASGIQTRIDGGSGNAALRVQGRGVMAGAGWRLGDSLELGVAAGHQRLDNQLRERIASAETDATEYGVYANYRWQGLSLRGGVTRAEFRTDTARTTAVGRRFSEDLLAREEATGITTFVRAGWTFGGPRLQLTPELELADVRLKSDGTHERGGESALKLDAADSHYRTGLAALKGDWDISNGKKDRAVVSARLGWQYADGDRLPTATARFVAGTEEFTIAGVPLARSSVLAQLGLALNTSAQSRLSLQMQGRKGDGQRDVGAQFNWSLSF